MVHVCCYHSLSLSRFVSRVGGSYFIFVNCRHDGPKNHQIKLFMGQKWSLSTQIYVVFLRKQSAARLSTWSSTTTGIHDKLSTLWQFSWLFNHPWLTFSCCTGSHHIREWGYWQWQLLWLRYGFFRPYCSWHHSRCRLNLLFKQTYNDVYLYNNSICHTLYIYHPHCNHRSHLYHMLRPPYLLWDKNLFIHCNYTTVLYHCCH